MDKIKSILKFGVSKIDNEGHSLGYVALGIGIILLLTKISAIVKIQVLVLIYDIKSKELDLFHAANVIPEFIFSTIVIGGINAALIPLFSKIKHFEETKFKEIFSSIVNAFLLTLIIISVISIIFAEETMLFTLSFKASSTVSPINTEDISLLTDMFRILMISPVILCISSIFSGILQVKKSFWITTIAPLFYNLGVILFAFISSIYDKNPMFLAYGVVFASLMHFLVQLPMILKKKIGYSLNVLDIGDENVMYAIKNTIPRAIGLAFDYFAYIFQSFIALNAVTGTLNSFKLAISLREVPYSLFGLSIAQSVFPTIAEYGSKNDLQSIQRIFSKSVNTIFLFTIPCIVVFVILRTPISQLLFGLFKYDGDFDGIKMVSFALLFISPSILFISMIGLINRVFYALNDVKTPVLIALFTLLVEILLTYTLVRIFSHMNEALTLDPIIILRNFENFFTEGNSPAAVGGIVLSNTIATGANFIISLYSLSKKGVSLTQDLPGIRKKIVSGVASFVLGLLFFKYANQFFDTTKTLGVALSTMNSFVVIMVIFYLSEKLQKDRDIEFLEETYHRTTKSFSKIITYMKRNKLISAG